MSDGLFPLKESFISPESSSSLSSLLPETFNTLHINYAVADDGPTLVNNCARRSAVCVPRPQMIGADKRDLQI